MNKVHRIVWSDRRQAWVVTHENAGTRGKPSSTRQTTVAAALAALLGTMAAPALAAGPPSAALPSGGQVVGGAASIGTQGARMDIVQSSARAAIDWQSFNIGASAQVHFNQPAGGATLNRVLGTDASQIFGKLTSTGQVFLVNPNGVLFAPGAQVNVGGLVASTRGISHADFMAGRLTFEGSSSGSIINQADISTTAGGTVALIAARIVNTGSITTPQGQVLMGAGNRVTLDLDGPVKIEVAQGALEALIEQGGAIRADGGLVYLTAKAASTLATAAINQSGSIEANALATGEKGQIFLMGDMAQGTLNVGGTLKAAGGFIETSAAQVNVQPGTTVQAGHWLIDPTDITVDTALAGTLQGQLASGNATVQTVATGSGNGDIFVNAPITWSSGNTLLLQAHRNVEVNATLDASAGSGGRLRVETGLGAVASGNRATFTANAPVLLQGSGAANGNNGNTATNFSTRLGSDGSTVNHTVVTTAAGLAAMNASAAALGGSFALGADVSLQGVSWAPIGAWATFGFTGRLDGLGHTVSQLTLSGDSFMGLFGKTRNAQISNLGLQDFRITATAVAGAAIAGALVGQAQAGTELRNIRAENIVVDASAGGTRNAWGRSMVGGLVGSAEGVTINGVRARNVSVTGRSDLGGIAGSVRGESRIADAQIDGLTITITGYVPGSSSNVGGISGSLTGSVTQSSVRGLDIRMAFGAFSSGYIGGLVGDLFGGGSVSSSVSDSYAAGRIVANNYTGMVSGIRASGSVGGLVGRAVKATLDNVYSLVDVKLTGDQADSRDAGLGGLVGRAQGSGTTTITNAYATGKVEHNFTGTAANFVGGFLGAADNATVNNGFWDSSSSGVTKAIGSATAAAGSVGGTGVKAVLSSSASSTAFWASSYTGFDFNNSWFMVAGETRPFLRSEWSPTVRNAHQLQLMAMNLSASYTLANNIDLAPALTLRNGMWKNATSSAAHQGNWVPVGNNNTTFSGSLDGQGHTVANLFANKGLSGASVDRVGLFGFTESAALRNIGVVNANVTGRYDVGALVGRAKDTAVDGAYSTGTVAGIYATGGLVGNSSGPVSNSYSTATVAGGDFAGGLVGDSGGLISNSYSAGQVSGHSNVGGLVGINAFGISNAYSTGAVTSTGPKAGGLAGSSLEGITNAFSTGLVTGPTEVGGLVGKALSLRAVVTNGFWNTSTSGQSTSAGGVGKTTAQMQEAATYAAWGSSLGLDPAVATGQYPKLRWATPGVGAGTSAWVIYGAPSVSLSYSLGAAPSTATYNGGVQLLGGAWNAAGIFGSDYSNWVAGTDYSFSYSGSTVTGFTNAGTYSGIGINILKSGFAVASTGNTAGSFTIDPKLLTGAISGGGSVYGSALTAGTVTFSGIVGNDRVNAGTVSVNTATMGRSASGNMNAGTYAGAQTVGSALSGASAGNYRFAGATANYSITPKTITSVGNFGIVPRVYDGSTTATLSNIAWADFNGKIAGDQLTVASASAVFTNPNAGTQLVDVTGITLGGASAGNYVLGSSSRQISGEIAPKPLTVSNITAAGKVYDGTTTATINPATAVFNGIVGTDQVGVTVTSGNFTNPNAGADKQVKISGVALVGSAAGNYTLSSSNATTTATITPKALTVSGLVANDKTYDGSTAATLNTGSASLVGLVGGDTPTLSSASGSFADANAGTGKAVAVSSLSLAGAGAGNYTVAATTATGTINKAPLLLNANNFVSSAGATPSLASQSGCVLASTCVTSIGLAGNTLSLVFDNSQLASNYSTTLQVANNAGSLAVNRDLSWSGFNLALNAATDIHINKVLSATGASDQLSLVYGQSAVAAANPYSVRYGLTDAGFSGQANLQAGQNFSTRQGSNGSTINWTVVTALGASNSSGDGTLQGMRGNLAGNFVLGADIDASATSGWNAGTGWTAIGDGTNKFTGRFDGLGHSVSNLSVNKSNATSNNHQGLFGYTSGASLANVGIDNASISAARFMGGLVGQGDATQINNTYARNVTLTGERGVGGLAGFLRQGSNVNDSFATGETRGNGTADISFHGGLVGLAEGFDANGVAANIRRSFANVNVATAAGSDAARLAGGLVGQFRGNGVIEDSFALGSVRGRGSDGTGGLVGRLGTGAQTPTLTRSWASGAVTGTGNVSIGGLLGEVNTATVTNSFWDTQTSGQATSAGGAGAVGKTSEQMQRLDTFADAGWNIAVTYAADYAGISDFRRAGQSLDGSGQWRINPRFIPYSVPTIASGQYGYSGQAQTPVEWNSRSILGEAFAGWVLGTDYVLTSGGNNLSSVTNAGSYSNLSVSFLRGGAGHYQNTSSGNTPGNLTVDKASLVVRANNDARFVIQAENPSYTGVGYTGFKGSDNAASLGGTLAIARSGGGNNAVGSYTLTPSGLSSGNYNFSYEDGAYQIVAADKLLVKAGTMTVAYGQALAYTAPTVQYVAGASVLTLDLSSQNGGSFVFAENGTPANTVGFTLQANGTSTSGSGWVNAGAYAVGGSAFSANTPNFIGSASDVVYSGWLKVLPKEVSVAIDASKTYDRSTGFTAAVTASGVLSGDSFALAGSGNFNTIQAGSQVGYTFTATASGSDAGNYVVAGAQQSGASYSIQGNNGRIDQKALSLSGLAANHKVYDGSTVGSFGGTAALGGVVAGDTLTVGGSALGEFASRNAGTGQAVTLAGLFLEGAAAGNYLLNLGGSTTADITPASISAVTGIAAAAKVYDGNTSVTLYTADAGFSGMVAGDSLSVTSATGSFADRNAGAAKLVNISGITLGGTHAANYTLASTSASTTARISQASISAVGGFIAAGKTYDGSSAATLNSSAAVFNGRLGSDVLTVANASGAFADANAGTAKSVTVSGITLGGADAGNYRLVDDSASTTADISAKLLTLSGSTVANKVYDGSTDASVTGGTITGLVGAETLALRSTGSFASKDAGQNKAVSASHTLADGSNGGLARNYSLATETLAADISQATATVTGNSGSTVYSGQVQSVAGYTVAGLVGDEDASVLSGISASGASATNAGTTPNVVGGTASNGNYSLSFVNGSLVIDKAEATVTAHSASGVYTGVQQSASGFSASGLVHGETASVLTGVSAGVTGTNAGSYTSVASGSDGNYRLSFVDGELRIERANATVTGNSGSGIYTGQAQGVTGYTVSGLVNGETSSVLNGVIASGATGTQVGSFDNTVSGNAVNGNYTLSFVNGGFNIAQAVVTATANSSTGTYNGQAQSVSGFTLTGLVNGESASVLGGITASGASATDAGIYANTLDGNADNGNYRVNFVDGWLDISKALATVTANSGTGTYTGQMQTVSGYTVSGLVNGETASVLTDVTAGGEAINVGTTTIQASGSHPNYRLNFVDGTLVISKALATVTANSGSRTYNGQAQSLSGFTVNGLVHGETAAVLSGVDATVTGTNAGSYAHSVSGPLDNGNYSLSFVDGSFVIHKAALSVAGINAIGKAYDGNTSATLDLASAGFSGLQGNDTLSVASASASFADKNVGNGKRVSISGITLGGTAAGNYLLADDSASTTADISAKLLTLSGSRAANKVYDGSTGATVTAGTVMGLVGAETLVLSSTGRFAGKDAGQQKTVTASHTLADGSQGGLASNYSLATETLAADISQATAIVTANSGSSTYNGQAQSLSGFTVSGLVNGETAAVLSGVDATVTGTNAGSYAHSVSGPLDNGNYSLSFVDGSFVIHKASLSVSGINAIGKTYDGNTSATLGLANAGFSGLQGNDTLSVASASASFADKNVGNGKRVSISGITLGGTAAGNYTLTSTTASSSADIQRLASVSWVGGSSGSWFDPANWAGGAVPDLANVAQVVIPANVTVSFNTAGAMAPAVAGQPVQVDGISGATASLNVADGQLNVANSLTLAGYAQTGGTVNIGGEFTASQGFQQTGGVINGAGPVSIQQAQGSMVLGNINAISSLTARAQGDITQAQGSALVVAGATTAASSSGVVTLANTANRFGSPPVIRPLGGTGSGAEAGSGAGSGSGAGAGPGTTPASAIANVQRMATQAGAVPGAGGLGGVIGMNRAAGGRDASGAAGAPQQSGGLLLVESTDVETPTAGETGRDASGYLRVGVVDGGINLPESVKTGTRTRQAGTR